MPGEPAYVLWSRADIPALDEAIVGTCLRWGGNLGRLGTKAHVPPLPRRSHLERRLEAESRSGMLRKTADPERSPLGRGHRHLGKRRWDDLIQRHVEERREPENPWQQATQDRTAWAATEKGFAFCGDASLRN